jgi:hypothetical protein
MTQYKVLVRLANGSTVWTYMSAQNIGQAKQLAEAQYSAPGVRVLQVITNQ